MTDREVQRKLAAILVADMVGFSRLMATDETGTLAGLQEHRREIIDPKIGEYGGRIVKLIGDGMLAEFLSVVDAVQCAIDIQNAMARRNVDRPDDRRFEFRIGVNLGDVIVVEDDIYGDGVNVAARLEGLAEPGGICVSRAARDQIRDKMNVSLVDLGEVEVKNIPRPVRAFKIDLRLDQAAAEPGLAAQVPETPVHDKPSIAVLPFDNMSGDPEQEYFADGLTEDIITALSLWRSFPVIARNSTFAYKGQSPDIRLVAKELGARYVLEGSVRTGGQRVRITAQLVDAATGHHVWAEKFDRKLEDIFELQDEITERIVATISPELERAEQKRSAAKAPTSLTAWDYYHRGMSLIYKSTKEDNIKARGMFDRAVELDPNYGQAHSGLSFSHTRDLLLEFSDSRDDSISAALRTARQAVACDDTDAFAHVLLAIANMWPGEFDLAIAEAERAVELNPNSAFARLILGTALDNAGRSGEGILEIERSLQLNPRDPQVHISCNTLARAQLNAQKYEEAVACARKALSVRSDFPHAFYLLASALGHLGRLDEARKALAECERLQPGFVQKRAQWQPYRDAANNEHIHEGVRKGQQTD